MGSKRHRIRRWTSIEIHQLWKAGLLWFLPDIEIQLRLEEIPRPLIERGVLTYPEALSGFESVLDPMLKPLVSEQLRVSQLQRRLNDLFQGLSKLNRDSDARFVELETEYIHRRLGVPGRAAVKADSSDSNANQTGERIRLAGWDQLSCLLEWTDVPWTFWIDPDWRECMVLRYDRQRISPVGYLGKSVMSRLDRYSDELRQQEVRESLPDGAGDRIGEILRSQGAHSSLKLRIAYHYVDWKVLDEGDQLWAAVLVEPVTNGKFFTVFAKEDPVADPLRFGSLGGGTRTKFLRYLVVPEGDSRAAVGRVLSYLLRLQSWFESDWTAPLPPDLKEFWPVLPLDGVDDRLKYAEPLLNAYTETLGLDRRHFQRINAVYVLAILQQAKPRRSAAREVIFWAARILDTIHPERHRDCREWCAFFRKRLRQAGKTRGMDAELNRMRGALDSDPLLNCVFHSDVLGGRERIRFRPGKRGANNLAINVTLAHAAQLLRPEWPKGSIPSVTRVLSSASDLPREVRNAVSDDYDGTPQAVDVPGASLFAYLTPYAVALFGNKGNVFNPGTVKWRCSKYADLPEVEALKERSLTESIDALIREEQIALIPR